jgi:nitrogen regulatory protein PII
MVLIEAILKPFKLDDVKEALEDLGVGGMTIVEVMQTSPQKPRGRSFGGGDKSGDLSPRAKLIVAAPSQMTERVIEAICLHGSAGKNEDGLITVERIEAAIRIRTGDMDQDALLS